MAVSPAPILLVDDDIDVLETLGMVLELAGYAVAKATHAAHALRLAAEDDFYVALVDYRLIGSSMNGLELIARLRDASPHTVCLLITVHNKGAVAAFLANVDVTAEEQKTYLKSGFDILFTEVDLWSSPGVRAVDKAIWYQYMDTGQRYDDVCREGMAGGMGWKGYVPTGGSEVVGAGQTTGSPDVPWWFGLYHGDKETPKPARCAFAAYPGECQYVFLPLVLKNH
jgi:CheY-like chemotaxis protein